MQIGEEYKFTKHMNEECNNTMIECFGCKLQYPRCIFDDHIQVCESINNAFERNVSVQV